MRYQSRNEQVVARVRKRLADSPHLHLAKSETLNQSINIHMFSNVLSKVLHAAHSIASKELTDEHVVDP